MNDTERTASYCFAVPLCRQSTRPQEPEAKSGPQSHLLPAWQLNKFAIDFPFYLTFIKRSAKVLRCSTYLLPKLLTNIQNLYM